MLHRKLTYGLLATTSLAAVLYLTLDSGRIAQLTTTELEAPVDPSRPETQAGEGFARGIDSGDIHQLVATIQASLPTSGTEVKERLKECLEKEPLRRADAARALGRSHSPALVPLFVALLNRDPDPGVRVEAAAALEAYEASPVASLALVDALKDKELAVREHAFLSLRVHRNDTVQAALVKQLKNRSLPEDLREEVAVFLDRYYPPLDPLADPLKSPSGS